MTHIATWKYRLDLHIHTRCYSPCAEALDPDRLPEIMRHKRLDGVVITEHDQLWPAAEIAALNRRLKLGRIYRGVEVSSCNGHFIVIGLDDMGGIRPGIGIKDLIQAANKQNAAVIWAHPFLNYGNVPEPLSLVKMPQGIHALEAVSGVTQGENTAKALAFSLQRGWVAVGGSDAHVPGQVGCVYTRFPRLPKNEKTLAAAIRSGKCKIEVNLSRSKCF